MPTTTEFAQLALDCIGRHTSRWNQDIPSEPFLEIEHGIFSVTKEKEWFRVMREVDHVYDFVLSIPDDINVECFCTDFVRNNPDLLTYINSLSENDKDKYFARCEAMVPASDSHTRDDNLMYIFTFDEVAYRMYKEFTSMTNDTK